MCLDLTYHPPPVPENLSPRAKQKIAADLTEESKLCLRVEGGRRSCLRPPGGLDLVFGAGLHVVWGLWPPRRVGARTT